MASPRLPFLYPYFFRSVYVSEASLSPRSWPSVRSQSRTIRPSKRRHQSTFAQRYGPAAEPIAPLQSGQPEENGGGKKQGKATKKAATESTGSKQKQDADTDPEQVDPRPEPQIESKFSRRDAEEAHPAEITEGPQLEAPSKPLEKVLHMEPPTASKAKADDHKHPHLQAPPYVHHFDTYTLVKDLGKGGYTQDQSITVMKAVRGLLATNLDLAKDGLVSKSDVENVCSLPKF